MATIDNMARKEGIIAYILANAPQTHTALQNRAQTHEWYTEVSFDTLMAMVASDGRISASVRDGEPVYFRKTRRPATRHVQYRVPCPPLIVGVNDSSHPALEGIECCMMFMTAEAWQETPVHRVWCPRYV